MVDMDDVNELKSVPHDKVVCVDTETTGLDPDKDEILQMSFVDGDGNVLFDSLIKPAHRKRWPKAQEINGISPADVKDKPMVEDVADRVRDIISNADVLVGYNLDFDVQMLGSAGIGIGTTKRFDVMPEYARAHGKWNDYYGDYTFVKLTTACHHYHIKFDPHDSSQDAMATIRCFYALLDDDEWLRPYVAAQEKKDAVLRQEEEERERKQALERAEREKRERKQAEIEEKRARKEARRSETAQRRLERKTSRAAESHANVGWKIVLDTLTSVVLGLVSAFFILGLVSELVLGRDLSGQIPLFVVFISVPAFGCVAMARRAMARKSDR
ncbi:MAG: 3'-5' exonuclease [Atopobiaceae bacterium]|jgi:DNA polymerase III epsilon subunit-like protein|nr:3'-5' exonuclease [Atopobiaceae bacterium]